LLKGQAPSTGTYGPTESPTVIVLAEDTYVYVNGSETPVNTQPLGPGDYLFLNGLWSGNGNMLVEATFPVLMYQTLSGGGTASATTGLNFIPPLGGSTQTAVDNIADVSLSGTATIGFITTPEAVVTLNGLTVSQSLAKTIPGTSEWVTYKLTKFPNGTPLKGDVSVVSTETMAVLLTNLNDPVGSAGYFSGFPPALVDLDFDGIPDGEDNCPEESNPGQGDMDGDGFGDACDDCPDDPDKVKQGECGCGVADVDEDNDGTLDCLEVDYCPDDPDKEVPGICGCGVPDTDTDADNVPDCNDPCFEDPEKVDPGVCGCGTSDIDFDFDGVPSCFDECDEDNTKIDPGQCGCGNPDTDTDEDGTADCVDNCPDDYGKSEPGICGCGVADTDSDVDTTADCNDGCPNDANKIAPGICGCGVADTDSDTDGTADCNDGCPNDANKTALGICGCGVSDIDSDTDGTADCNDGCYDDVNKTAPGICGCGVADTDTDGDGTADCNDNCIIDANTDQADMDGDGLGDICDDDIDGDGYPIDEDCDDYDAAVNPDADEDCEDGIDNNCDGFIDGADPQCDADGDGTPNDEDGCPLDANKIEPGQCGCHNPDTDTDGDGTADCIDECDTDPYKTLAGVCGCGYSDECQFAGQCLGEGESACADDVSNATCTNRAIFVASCGTDFCTDSGDNYGAGSCDAVDYFCDAGQCKSTATNGTDSCGEEEVFAADLSTWTEESLGSANWIVSADKQSVKQWFNGDPTIYYSDYNAIGGTLTGKISVESSSDDDYIGFVLGFQPGDTTNANADYLLVDWKQGNQNHTPWGGYGYRGLAISRVTGIADNTAFWSHSGAVQELQRGATLGSTGWLDNVEYEFRIEFSATRVKVYVNNSLELDVTGSFNDGRFGFYNLSQAYVSYAGLATIPVLEDDCPKVSFYECHPDGNACVAAETDICDSCSDSGTAFGGGGCEAVNWTCTAGELTSSDSSGMDTCGGTAAAPSVSYFTCAVDAGVMADTCVALETFESDFCADDGSTYGGGTCSATDWTCEDGVLAMSSTNGTDVCGEAAGGGTPASGGAAALAPEAYWRLGEASGTTAYDETGNGHNGTYVGPVDLGVEGVTEDGDTAMEVHGNAAWMAVHDVPVTQSFTALIWARSNTAVWNNNGWAWSARNPNGFIIHPDHGTNRMGLYIIDQYYWSNHTRVGTITLDDITEWHQYGLMYDADTQIASVILDGEVLSTVEYSAAKRSAVMPVDMILGKDQCCGGARYGNGALDEAILFTKPLNDDDLGQAYTGSAPGAISAVTYFVCENNNSCVAQETVEYDSCSDDGDAYGGGSCSATDWDCNAGVLAKTDTSGTDTCGGTDDAPSIGYFVCENNNACVGQETVENDSCSDDGGAYGGGSCSATDWDCNDGILASTGNSGTDTCGGTDDAPSVDYWVCSAGDGTAADLCVADTTAEFDACTDNGNAYGGGSCAATDWDCEAGVLASTGNSGADTCGGTVDAPTVDFWVCTAGDGTAADLCVADTTAEFDACTDNGNAYGGGSCSATDWDCEAGILASTGNSGADTCGGTEDAPTVDFWVCTAGDGTAADLCVADTTAEFDSCAENGGAYGGGSCVATDWDCSGGVLASTGNDGLDTCGGSFDAPTVEFWGCTASDGAIEDLCVADTTAEFDACTDNGNAYGGGSCAATDWDCEAGVLASTGNSGADTCGGTVDAPTVDFWGCAASDGDEADLCVVDTTAEFDACADSGNDFGGGACAATDWDCSDGTLASTSNDGTDTCGGTADVPNVEYWVCTAGDGAADDICTSDVTEKTDVCVDTGTPSGGGVCDATDWVCEASVLSSTSTSGVDTCGDGSGSQVDYWVCDAVDGTDNDLCVAIPDVTPPALTCPEKVVSECTRFDGVYVPGVLASVDDICDDTIDTVNDYNSGGLDASDDYVIGITDVNFTSIDDADNVSECLTQVEVVYTPWSFAVYAGDKHGLHMHKSAHVIGEVYSADDLHLHDYAMVEGAAFARDKVHIHKKATITDGLYADGNVKNDGNAFLMGGVPEIIPVAPVLDATWYQDQLDGAALESKGNVDVNGTLDLAGGTLLVNGKFKLKKNGILTGPGTIVATDEIHIEKDSFVGNGITLIAGKHIDVKKDVSVGTDALLFAYDHIHVDEGTTIASGALVSGKHIHLKKETTVIGVVFAEGDVKLDKDAQVTGTVISLQKVDMHDSAVVIHDCAAIDSLPPGLGMGVPPSDDDDDAGDDLPCGECDGKVTELSLQYNGADVAYIEVEQKKEGAVFAGDVAPGEVFNFVGTDNGTLGTEISIYVDGVLNTAIHASCSKPIAVSYIFGDFEVVDGASLKGGPLCLMTQETPAEEPPKTDPPKKGKKK
jgi:predicted acyltransferase (DUF342 family)